MSNWETAPEQVTEKTLKDYMGLENGYAGPAENPNQNLAMLDEELARKNLQPGAREILMAERGKLSGQSADVKWEDAPAGNWEDAPSEKKSTFDSGNFFRDTRAMLPDMPTLEGIKGGWDALTKDLSEARVEVAKIRAINEKPKGDRTDAEKKAVAEFGERRMKGFQDSAKNEHGAGAGVLDLVGGLPAMAIGGIHGVADGLWNKDATKGLKTASETMSSLLPSNLLPGYSKEDQQSEGYHAVMAPVTGLMDALNSVPQVVGEGINAMGYDKAATQVTDAGKLAIIAALGGKGAHSVMKGMKAKPIMDPAAKLEALRNEPVPEPTVPLEALETTAAHADDFAAINPYDVGGHVSEAQAGRPTMIDQAQGELFGGRNMQEAMPGPDMGQASIRHETMPYETTSPLALEPKTDGPTRLQEMGKELNEFDRPYGQGELGLEPMVRTDTPLPEMNKTRAFEQALAENRAAMEAPAKLENPAMQEAMKSAERESAFKEAEAVANAQKEAHYRALEDQNIAQRAGELDYQHARDVIGDKSLMSQDQSIMMRGQMRRGDVAGALKTIEASHPNAAYRELATYLQGKLDGIKIQMHPESIVKMGERDVTGYYDATTHTVGLSGLGATSPHTILHELSHAVTSRMINDRPTDIRVRGLNSLFTEVGKDGAMGKRFPGIVNAKEFVAEAFSNPKFQEFLKGRQMNNRSVWNRFVDGVRSIMGIPANSKLSSAFDQAMDLGKQIAEAQTGKQEALSQFKKAGMPNKLADLMAQKPTDVPVETRVAGGMEKFAKKIPGLKNPISDFAFDDRPMVEIIKEAADGPDIPNTLLEKFAQQMQGGALFESLKTRNIVVKKTYEVITRAFQEAAKNVKDNLTNPETGLKKYMRDLNPTEKGEIHNAMMMAEGQRELTATDLAAAGFNEKQINYAMKHRELDNKFFEAINERRAEAGLRPMDKRVAHIAGRFMGDFARMVTHEGKVVGRISGSTRGELNRATKAMEAKHPEWTYEKPEYNRVGHGKAVADRFAGMMEAINFLEKSDTNVKAFMDSYKGYLQQDAVNYLNATRHAKAKVKEAGGIVGSEGNKPWLDAIKNAEEGMKAQLAYYEQGYQWMAMEKATSELKQLLGNEDVIRATPNAVKYADSYVKHAMGRDQGKIADAANATASMLGELSGVGHSNIMKLSNAVKHRIMQKFMGLGNIPFTLTQLMQPLQTQPAMIRLMRNRGLEFSTADAQAKAASTYLHSMLEDQGAGKLSQFERDAVKYADEMSVFDVKMADHTKNINVSRGVEAFDKLADLNITAPEHLTRGMTFLFYSHMLKDAGMPAKDIFGAAENMTNMSMVNYHQIERPMGYAKLGWLGDVASTLTRYKHNQWSQLAFYSREAKNGGGVSPLATFLGTSLAFGGAMGFFAYQEADAAYSAVAEHVLKKPDSLTNQLLKSNLPDWVTHGVFSQLGLDMTSRFSNANAIPDSVGAALMPYGSAVMDIMNASGRYMYDPTNMFKAKQMAKAVAPQSVQGLLENHMFSTEKANGNKMYTNPTDGPNLGKGRVERTPGQQTLRGFGFRDIKESKELAQNYADTQMAKGHKNIAESQITKAQYAALDNSLTPEKYRKLIQDAADHGMSPDAFVSKMVTWSQDRTLTQKQQQLLRNANRGFTGAFNIKESQR